MKAILSAALLGSIFTVNYASQADSIAREELSVLEIATLTPNTLPDGSIWIARHQLVLHIGTPGVFILSADNRARFRMVKTGKTAGQSIEISSGLSGKEKIITGPFETVFDGSPIREIKLQLRKQ